MLGVIGGVSGLSAVIGPVLGGWLITADLGGSSWRSIFFLNVPVGILIFVLALAFVPNTKSVSARRLDVLGVVLLSGALLGLLYPLVEGTSLDWPAWLWLPATRRTCCWRCCSWCTRCGATRDGGLAAADAAVPRPRLLGRAGHAVALPGLDERVLARVPAVRAGCARVQRARRRAHAALVQRRRDPRHGGRDPAREPGVQARRDGRPADPGGLDLLGDDDHRRAQGTAFTGWDIALPMAIMGIGLALVVVPLVDIALATVPIADAGPRPVRTARSSRSAPPSASPSPARCSSRWWARTGASRTCCTRCGARSGSRSAATCSAPSRRCCSRSRRRARARRAAGAARRRRPRRPSPP